MENCGIKLIDAKTNSPIDLLKSGDDYYADLLPFTFYKLVIDAKDYVSYQGRIDPQLLITKEDRKKDIQLFKKRAIADISPLATKNNQTAIIDNKNNNFKPFERIGKGKILILNNVYFEQSSFILQKESYTELDKLAAMLSQNPNSKIQITGHTDNIGDSRLNQALSENRAKVILNYLVAKGIAEERLSYKGYGGSQSIVDNTTEENRKKNRRVEIVGIQ
ncbi:MAG: OmpA family protein [Pseudarcicella sp.]|nr:OmpA family protein [Pseudarcicella sp.]MBP6410496.1 OmpA family protein [Pseudarcicella sp.]